LIEEEWFITFGGMIFLNAYNQKSLSNPDPLLFSVLLPRKEQQHFVRLCSLIYFTVLAEQSLVLCDH
jgi:hypothetical protein